MSTWYTIEIAMCVISSYAEMTTVLYAPKRELKKYLNEQVQ